MIEVLSSVPKSKSCEVPYETIERAQCALFWPERGAVGHEFNVNESTIY